MAARSAFLNYASGQSYGALCDALANADGVINVAADLARQRSRWGPLTPKMGLKVPAAVPLPAAPAAGATTLSSHVFESEIDHDVVSENTTRHEPFSFDTTIDADLSNEARVFLSTTENVARFQRNATPRQIATAGVVEMETNGVGNVVHLGTPLADVSAAATEDSIEALQGSGAKSIIDVSNLSVDEARDAKVERDDDHANAACINNNNNDVCYRNNECTGSVPARCSHLLHEDPEAVVIDKSKIPSDGVTNKGVAANGLVEAIKRSETQAHKIPPRESGSVVLSDHEYDDYPPVFSDCSNDNDLDVIASRYFRHQTPRMFSSEEYQSFDVGAAAPVTTATLPTSIRCGVEKTASRMTSTTTAVSLPKRMASCGLKDVSGAKLKKRLGTSMMTSTPNNFIAAKTSVAKTSTTPISSAEFNSVPNSRFRVRKVSTPRALSRRRKPGAIFFSFGSAASPSESPPICI